MTEDEHHHHPIGFALGDPTAGLVNHDYSHNPVVDLWDHYDCHTLGAEL
jgi:hypothetical protein